MEEKKKQEERRKREMEEKKKKEEEEKHKKRDAEEKKKKDEEEKLKRFGFKEKSEPAKQNGAFITNKFKKTEKISRDNVPSTKADDVEKQEAERKLQELKQRRNNTESEEFEKMKQKQQDAEAELEELKRKREERRKILEEEERQRKKEQEEKKAKEQEERKRMKEEIEKRRAEAAEKKKQKEEEVSTKPAFTISPKGSSKIGEKAEFLSKSAQKSSAARVSHTPIVAKVGNRLEQYTSAIQGNKEVKSPKSPLADIPTGGTRNIKSMWEKGNFPSTSESPAPANKDVVGVKGSVAGRVNSWMGKPAEAEKTAAPPPAAAETTPPPAAKPAEVKPADVGSKRGMWETKRSSTPSKVPVGGKGRFT
ncbi:caldesmon, smooth muscle [Austrofundulus limnaeus]|uniref:Caldesmon, smooth muscle n=1 Tax=Austrofundulus limnaeus TaxID=52670 RepID=A0A2I4C5E8_AUSLI|nr:PREDICTED: caldesmon [Austrofundulus limnaeus]